MSTTEVAEVAGAEDDVANENLINSNEKLNNSCPDDDSDNTSSKAYIWIDIPNKWFAKDKPLGSIRIWK